MHIQNTKDVVLTTEGGTHHIFYGRYDSYRVTTFVKIRIDPSIYRSPAVCGTPQLGPLHVKYVDRQDEL